MALQQTVTTKSGIEVQDAYVRIDSVNGNKQQLGIIVRVYKDKAAADGNYAYLENRYYNFEPSVETGSPNFIKQGYEHLKTLPEYADAVDLLDESTTA